MLRARPIAGLVLEELIVDDSEAVTREDGQDFAVALAFRYHGASNHITLLTKPIDFGTLRSEIDMRVERAA
jgi:hypothetical protein